MDTFLFHHLKAERFISRWIKVTLDNMGVCRAMCVGVRKGQFVVEIRRRGVPEQYPVKPAICIPNWPENQDLLQESILAKQAYERQKEEVGVTTMAGALERAVETPKAVPAPKPQNNPAKPSEAILEQKKDIVEQKKDIVENTPSFKIKNLIIDPNVNGDVDWRNDLDSLKQALAQRTQYQLMILEAEEKLAEHDKYVGLCIDTLRNSGVEVVWDGTTKPGKRIMSGETPEGSFTPTALREILKEKMAVGKAYTSPELAALVGHETNARWTYLVKTATDAVGFTCLERAMKGLNIYIYEP